MLKLWPIVLACIAALFLGGAMVVNAGKGQPEKATGVVAPTPAAEKAEKEKKLAIATEAAKQLLLAMDTDKNGKISKQEWMAFMEAEFDRLDKAKTGQLDIKELTQSKLRVSQFATVGK